MSAVHRLPQNIASLLISLAFPSTGLFAQQEKPMVSAEVSVHVWQSAQTNDDPLPTYEGLFYQNGTEYTPIVLREGTRTDGVKYRGDGWFRLYNQEKQEDKLVYVPVGAVQLAPGSKQVLAYAFPSEGKFDLRAVDIDRLLSKPGQFQFANFSKKTMEVLIEGQEPLRVEPDGSAIISILENKGNALQFTIQVPHADGVRQVYSRSTAITPEGNYLGFLYDVAGREGQYRFFIERGLRRAEPTPEEKPPEP